MIRTIENDEIFLRFLKLKKEKLNDFNQIYFKYLIQLKTNGLINKIGLFLKRKKIKIQFHDKYIEFWAQKLCLQILENSSA